MRALSPQSDQDAQKGFPDPNLDEKETARFLKLKVKTLQAWRCRGDGPRFLKLGRAVRYRLSDIEAFVNERTRTSTSDPGPKVSD